MTVCVFACAKNEDLYISEWAYYHLKLGFDKIIIYDTSDDFSLEKMHIYNEPNIEIHHKPNRDKIFRHELKIDEFIKNEKIIDRFKYVAIIDIDEFIILKQHDNINKFLEFMDIKNGCIGINWLLFGSNNNKIYYQSPVLNRFTYCSKTINNHIKCISVLQDIERHDCCPHHPILINGKQINEKGKELYKIQNENFKHPIDGNSSSFQMYSSNEYIQINHYAVKSLEEFNKRFMNHHTRSDTKLFLNEHDKNQIEDKTALEFLLKKGNYKKLDYHFYILYYSDLLINGLINEEIALEHFNNEGIKENRICNLNYNYDCWRNTNNSSLSDDEIWNIVREDLLKKTYNF